MRQDYLLISHFYYPEIGEKLSENIEIQNVSLRQIYRVFDALAYCFVNDEFFTHLDLFAVGSHGSFEESLTKINTYRKNLKTQRGK